MSTATLDTDSAPSVLMLDGAISVEVDPALWAGVQAAAAPLGLEPLGVRDVSASGRLGLDPALGPEGYRLTVRASGLEIVGGDPAGVAAGLAAVRQQLPPDLGGVRGHRPVLLAPLVAEDRPRHRWRGFMLDVARWYVPVDDILAVLEEMALWRLNVLHLHLTDDQGWRLQIDRWPLLTEIGAWRAGTTTRPAPRVGVPDPRDDDWGMGHRHDGVPHGGFYTAADIARIVAHASARHITVVPEIDLPGHSQAVLAAYPEFGAGRERVPVATRWGVSPHSLVPSRRSLAFAESVLGEVADLFPSPFVHIGGDECPIDVWAQVPEIAEEARRLGLPGPEALRPWFVDRCASALSRLGKTALYWFDGEVLAEGGIAVAWRGDDAAVSAARQGARVIAAPHESTYLDYFAGPPETATHGWGLVHTVDDARRFRPIPAGTDPEYAARFLGAQAQLWTEYAPNRAAREALTTPRLSALAQSFWGSGA